MQNLNSMERKRSILQYWSQIEFFNPYILDPILSKQQPQYRIYSDTPAKFPWSKKEPLQEDDDSNPMAIGYQLYLGLFNVEETADRARHVFCNTPNTWQSIEWRSSGADASLSCFARLSLTHFGTPLLSTLSLSTLPWAHGHLLDNHTPPLTMEAFRKSVKRLLKDLDDEIVKHLPKCLVKMPDEYRTTLDDENLSALTHLFFEWAQYFPKDYPIALIVPADIDGAIQPKEQKERDERTIPILNSFYIQDLERAICSIDPVATPALNSYLDGECAQRVALNDPSGQKAIMKALKPDQLPRGRWPSSPSHQLSLMQQFAVNQALNLLPEGGLFSVNGPPGTGKSTLLREMIAENVVARAQSLARFTQAQDAFTGASTIQCGEGDPIYASIIDDSLKGFEMVLVSSNNTAVQNLSLELPLRKHLDPAYSSASYLEPVACRLLGPEEGKAWGLISAALGNKSNCNKIVERLFFKRESEAAGKRIWDWIKEYSGPSFQQARERFLETESAYHQLADELETLASLHEEIEQKTLDQLFTEGLEKLAHLEQQFEQTAADLTQVEQEEKEHRNLLELLEYREKLWKSQRPRLIKRLMSKESGDEWSEQARLYTQQKIEAINAFQPCAQKLTEARKTLEEAKQEVEKMELELVELSFTMEHRKEVYDKLKVLHPEVRLFDPHTSTENPDVQKSGYFQTEALNRLRSTLFIDALALHEAWLAEVSKPNGGFRGNLLALSHLLQGKSPTTTEDTLLIWRSLFLLIPVISSTFASVERIFKNLGPHTLGWVFIDEAGQALPQAAIGAIWRAQRVLSIGDPFQIEPISSIPPEIVDGMAKHVLKDQSLSWAPTLISVQHLMDASTLYGAHRRIRERPYWLGSPLRVHRRCIEPMFSIANTIAYEDSMILAPIDNPPYSLPASCWYDIDGAVSGRQWVPAQGKELVRQLTDCLKKMPLPDIYIISPFREVVQQIQNMVAKDPGTQQLFKKRFKTISLPAWIAESVGTVHAFQGKQASVVFFILGGDQSTLGAVEWAARKPNLLNVAVTRACYRLYIIGGYELWHCRPYFEVAAKKLQRVYTA